jgi:hypothetical protein
MSHRATATAVIVLFVSAAVPSLGFASTGGGSTGGAGIGSGNGKSGSGVNADVQPGDVTVSATGDGITLVTRASALLRKGLTFTGTAPRSDAGKTVEIERLGHETGWSWASTVTATIAHNGSFTAVWHTNHIGRFAMRALFQSTAMAASADPTVAITVYRPSLATMYGPGFWGSRTACGQKLTRSMLGLANRTLKCGTKVGIYYHGRTLIVPVIDRGPYANGADWDLTEGVDKALKIPGTATIGAVSLPPAPSQDAQLTQG